MTTTEIDTGTSELLCAIRGRVAIITLNRPEVRNALSDHLTPALRTMIKTCGENPEVGALLITGAGSAFCAGGNVKGMGAHRDKKKLEMPYDEKVADLQERQRLLTGALVSVRKPTIAALPGPAVGAGLAIAMACDIRIAAEDAQLGQPEIKLGLIPGGGGTQRLPRLVGHGRALLLNLSGDPISGSQAYDWGLVEKAVPRAELLDAALELARTLSQRSPHAMGVIKELAAETRDLPLSEGMRREAQGFIKCIGSEDGAEGVVAFLEKRQPEFTGR